LKTKSYFLRRSAAAAPAAAGTARRSGVAGAMGRGKVVFYALGKMFY
jgi:hypothetical protein